MQRSRSLLCRRELRAAENPSRSGILLTAKQASTQQSEVEVVDSGSYASAFTWAEQQARTWFLDPDGHDRFVIDGLGAGGPLLVEAFDRFRRIASTASGPSASSHSPTRLAKDAGMDRMIRAWSSRLIRRDVRHAPTVPILFLSELATPSTLAPMLAVAAAMRPDHPHVTAADPRALRRWLDSGYEPRGLTIDVAGELRTLGRVGREARSRWRDFVAARPRWEYAARDITEGVLATLKPLVTRSVPWLHVERAALARRLEQARPQWVVVATDQHRIGYLARQATEDVGARMMVLQHGLPQASVGFLPVRADVVATWSQASVDWFVRGGTDRHRLVLTGNPRLDQLAATRGAMAAGRMPGTLGLAGSPRLVVVLSGANPETNAWLVATAIEAIRSTPHGALIVRLHPGLREWGSVRRMVERAGAVRPRIRLSQYEPLYPILRWANATFLEMSSVAAESLVAGTPVIVGARSDHPAGLDDLGVLELPHVGTVAELVAAVQTLADAATRIRFLAERERGLEWLAGPLDGRAGARIADFLLASDRPTGQAVFA